MCPWPSNSISKSLGNNQRFGQRLIYRDIDCSIIYNNEHKEYETQSKL